MKTLRVICPQTSLTVWTLVAELLPASSNKPILPDSGIVRELLVIISFEVPYPGETPPNRSPIFSWMFTHFSLVCSLSLSRNHSNQQNGLKIWGGSQIGLSTRHFRCKIQPPCKPFDFSNFQNLSIVSGYLNFICDLWNFRINSRRYLI